MKYVELRPVKEKLSEYDVMEKRIKLAFKKYFYGPLLASLGLNKISNSKDDLIKAIESGRIAVSRGTFSGKFDAGSTKALKDLGAVWSNGKFKLKYVPVDIRSAVSTAQVRYEERLARIDKILEKTNPAEIAGKVKTADLFARTLQKTNDEMAKTVKKISVMPKLDPKQQEKIAEEWQNNMDLWISNFTEKEIVRLRKDVAALVSQGNRHDAIIDVLQKSYGVTANKAKFLAKQETSLLMAKFKETRYTSLGINEYKWRCVAGSANHPVRPSHKILDGKIFRWDDPPITTMPDEPTRRNNPGQDYNCRCQAIPIVKF